jgi:hypothetical protein
MKIRVEEDVTGFAPRAERFYAIDDDSYDGAEDAGPRAQACGRGATPNEAIAALLEILEEMKP